MPEHKRLPDLELENARLLKGGFMNFKGEKTKFKAAGNRFFHIQVPDEDAGAMIEDGWNVKKLNDREVDGDVQPGSHILEVSVKFDYKPPSIYMVSEVTGGLTRMKEDMVDMLDDQEVVNWDLVITPYSWEMPNGNSGIKAYLKELYATVRMSRIGQKYSQTPMGD